MGPWVLAGLSGLWEPPNDVGHHDRSADESSVLEQDFERPVPRSGEDVVNASTPRRDEVVDGAHQRLADAATAEGLGDVEPHRGGNHFRWRCVRPPGDGDRARSAGKCAEDNRDSRITEESFDLGAPMWRDAERRQEVLR